MSQKNQLRHFYNSFQQKNFRAMTECYHSEAIFEDEVFELKGKQIAAMWHMLCERGKDLQITYGDITTSGNEGSANWEAIYTFSKTGRKVHNLIKASFQFKDGKIIEHRDRFNFWKWSGMALGVTGWLLGWTPLLKRKISENARQSLNGFIAKYPEYQ